MKPNFVVSADINIYRYFVINSTPKTIKRHKQRAVCCPSYEILFFFLLFIFCNCSIAQTSIVGVITPDQITVGADSRGIRGNETIDNVCKIIPVQDMYFAMAGVIEVPEVGFYAFRTAQAIGEKPTSILNRMNIFAESLKPELGIAANWVKKNDPALFESDFRNKYLLQVIFFGIERENPVLFCRYFKTIPYSTDAIDVQIESWDCPGDCVDRSMYALLGEFSNIHAILNSDQSFWSKRQIHESIKFLIGVEARMRSDKVGGAIDILHLPRIGSPIWINRKPSCADEQQKIIHTEPPKPKNDLPLLAITLATILVIVTVLMIVRKKKNQHTKETPSEKTKQRKPKKFPKRKK